MNKYRMRYIRKHKMEFIREKIAYYILAPLGYCWADLVFWYQDQSRSPFEDVRKVTHQECIDCNYCGRGFRFHSEKERK